MNKAFTVATTDATKVTAVASGSTVICIATEDGNKVATHTVTVSKWSLQRVVKSALDNDHGETP